MSRSGYIEDCDDNWQLIKWRGWVASATRGRRGQKLFRDLLEALDSMPEKRLIPHQLENEAGEVCALGAAGRLRGVKMSGLDPDDSKQVAEAFDIAHQLAAEIVCVNDEWGGYREAPEKRWKRMRAWVEKQIIEEPRS